MERALGAFRKAAVMRGGAVAFIALVCGCAPFRPAEMPITLRDEVALGAPVPAGVQAEPEELAALEFAATGKPAAVQATLAAADSRSAEKKYKVAILSPAGSGKNAQINRLLEAQMSSLAGDLEYFVVVPRAEGSLIAMNSALEGGEGALATQFPEAEYLLISECVSANAERKPREPLDSNTVLARLEGRVTASFKLYEKASDSLVISKSISSRSETTLGAASDINASEQRVLEEAAQSATSEFSLLLADRYAPPAKVIMTRGSGEAALIDLGENYGIAVGSAIEFYYIDPEIPDEDAQRVGIGYGEVVQVDTKSAWIKVNKPSSSRVMKGHLARVVRRPKGAALFNGLLGG